MTEKQSNNDSQDRERDNIFDIKKIVIVVILAAVLLVIAKYFL
ncbi:MAG TPA: hypothetical protein PK573_04505 [Spirochaetota bacterium]|nr:hypothetical protein [Spirochaetota bacterium]HRZ27545.1 hypothetical protein [Spirochaetota bacterium]HSA13655.1 hypothetical protein [Spirochaetota bacterium]